MTTEFQESESLLEGEKQGRTTVLAATAKKWNKAEAHIGAKQVRIVGSEKSSTGMSKLAKVFSGRKVLV